MAYRVPGKHKREGLSTRDFFRMFPDDAMAEIASRMVGKRLRYKDLVA